MVLPRSPNRNDPGPVVDARNWPLDDETEPCAPLLGGEQPHFDELSLELLTLALSPRNGLELSVCQPILLPPIMLADVTNRLLRQRQHRIVLVKVNEAACVDEFLQQVEGLLSGGDGRRWRRRRRPIPP